MARVDQGCTGAAAAQQAQTQGLRLEAVRLPQARRGFVLLPRRRVVERSFARATRFRRLVRDYERLPDAVRGLHFVAFACLMLAKAITPPGPGPSQRLGGARVDEIAERAKANERMIYHYFESKEGLFQAVLEQAHLDIRAAEQKLNLDHLDAGTALEKLVRFTWESYLENPEFITLVNSENLHPAKRLKKSEVVQTASRRFVGMVGPLLDRGVAEGVFRPGVDPVQRGVVPGPTRGAAAGALRVAHARLEKRPKTLREAPPRESSDAAA